MAYLGSGASSRWSGRGSGYTLRSMAHQAYFFAGDVEEGRREALGFAERLTGVSAQGNPDIISLTHGLFSVEDARKVGVLAGSRLWSANTRCSSSPRPAFSRGAERPT